MKKIDNISDYTVHIGNRSRAEVPVYVEEDDEILEIFIRKSIPVEGLDDVQIAAYSEVIYDVAGYSGRRKGLQDIVSSLEEASKIIINSPADNTVKIAGVTFREKGLPRLVVRYISKEDAKDLYGIK